MRDSPTLASEVIRSHLTTAALKPELARNLSHPPFGTIRTRQTAAEQYPPAAEQCMKSLLRLFSPAARMPSDKAKAFVQDRITTHKVRLQRGALQPVCTVWSTCCPVGRRSCLEGVASQGLVAGFVCSHQ